MQSVRIPFQRSLCGSLGNEVCQHLRLTLTGGPLLRYCRMSGLWGGLPWWCQQRLDALLQCVQVGQGLPELLLLCLRVVRIYPRWHSGRLLVPA